VKVHAINKEKSTKEFVGRKRKTAKKESQKHHPITARGLGDAFGAGKTTGTAPVRNPSL
jgi:hypothetical protein